MNEESTIEDLRRRAQVLRDQAKEYIKTARKLEDEIVKREVAERGLSVGQVVEGYWYVDVKKPKWVRGTIVGFFWGVEQRPTVTLEVETGVWSKRRVSFYLESIREVRS